MSDWPDQNTDTTSRIYNVEKAPYNAQPDAYFTDGVANTTTTFTSATANFTSADVGVFITIMGAGNSQREPHATTIASVTNSTTVVLTDAALRSQTSCRFYLARAGDQTAAFTAAIVDAGAAGGGTVYAPGVGYAITGLTLLNRVWIRGAGSRSTALRQMPASTVPVIRNDNTLNNSAIATGVFDLMILGSRKRQSKFAGTTAATYTAGSSTTLTVTAGQGASLLPTGIIELVNFKTVSAATNATPIQITTTTAHGFSTGNIIQISGAVGNLGANGKFTITVIDTTNFTLDTSIGTGVWTSGGSIERVTRLSYQSISGDVLTLGTRPAEQTVDATFASGSTYRQQRQHGIFLYQNPPLSNATIAEGNDAYHRVENVHVLDVAGDGIFSYGWAAIHVSNTDIDFADGVGIRPSFDSVYTSMFINHTARAGVLVSQAFTKMTNIVTSQCGDQNSSAKDKSPEGYGFLWDYTPAALKYEGGVTLTGCSAQDCAADGVWISNGDRPVLLGLLSSSNGTKGPIGRYVGVKITGTTTGYIVFHSTERMQDGSNSYQQNALSIDSASTQNTIRLSHGAAASATVGAVLAAGSVIDHSNTVMANGGVLAGGGNWWETTVVTTADHTGIGTTATNVAPASGPILSVALAAGAVYEFEASLRVDSSSTAGMNVGAAYSAGLTDFSQFTHGEGSTTYVSAAAHASGPTGGAYAVIATTKVVVHIRGFVKPSAAGNLTVQAKKLTSGTTGVYAGSALRVRQVA